MSENDTVRLDNLDMLISSLMNDDGQRLAIPRDLNGKQQLMRALMNVRPPLPATEDRASGAWRGLQHTRHHPHPL